MRVVRHWKRFPLKLECGCYSITVWEITKKALTSICISTSYKLRGMGKSLLDLESTVQVSKAVQTNGNVHKLQHFPENQLSSKPAWNTYLGKAMRPARAHLLYYPAPPRLRKMTTLSSDNEARLPHRKVNLVCMEMGPMLLLRSWNFSWIASTGQEKSFYKLIQVLPYPLLYQTLSIDSFVS